MDETNPKDATNPATGSEPAPVPPEALQPQLAAGQDQTAKALHNDMARILEDVKLPERREFVASGDIAKRNEAAKEVPALQTMPSGPETKKVQADTAENPPAPQTRNGQDIRSSVPPLHTLKDDLQSTVRDKKMSIVHAVALEEEKKRGREKLEGGSGTEHKHTRAILLIFALILLAGGALYGIYVYNREPAPASAAPEETPLFFADKTVPFPLGASSGTDLKRTLAQGLNAPRASLGAVMRIMPIIAGAEPDGAQRERVATVEEFLNAIGAQASPDLLRAFRSDFFLGINAATDRNVPILVISVSSYERAFAGMLAWEATINDDLAPFFTLVPSLTVDESGLLVNRKFEDGIVQNYDIRALKDDSGAVKLMYSFPTRNMLVIVEDPYSFTEVLGRLRAARQI